jgi:hypothetical protein
MDKRSNATSPQALTPDQALAEDSSSRLIVVSVRERSKILEAIKKAIAPEVSIIIRAIKPLSFIIIL